MKFPITLHILLLFVAALFFTACEKDNVDEIVIDEPEYTPNVTEGNNLLLAMRSNSSDGLDLGCLTILYPFDLTLESGNTVTINTESDFTTAIDTTAADPAVDFVYPLDILDAGGNNAQVSSIDELGQSFVACIPNSGWTYGSTSDLVPAFSFTDLCFDLVYPVALEDLDGNTYTADDEADLIDLIATVDDLFFTLPITVMDAEGDELTIESYDGFSNLVESCDGVGVNPPVVINGGIEVVGFGCWELQYPFTLQLSDGTTVDINDEDEYITTILNADDEFQVAYPFTLLSLLDGGEVTITNGDEFLSALEACGLIIDTGGNDDDCGTSPGHILLFFNEGSCYTINYPAQVQAEGVTYDLNSTADYFNVYSMYASQINAIEIIYPISVTNTADGTETTFNNRDEICDYINACYDDNNDYSGCDNPSDDDQTIHVPLFFSAYNFFSVFDCPFDFEYPVQIEVEGITYDINNRDDYTAVVSPFTPGEATLIFPITVIEDGGNTVTLDSNADVCSFITSCP